MAEIEFENERQMEDLVLGLLRDRNECERTFGEPLEVVGRQLPVARTVSAAGRVSRPRMLDVLCLDADGGLVVLELKTVLDEKFLLQGLTYARWVHQNAAAWYEALGHEPPVEPRVSLWLFNWGLHDTWLDLLPPLRSAYGDWLADLRYYGCWIESSRAGVQVERIDTMEKAVARERGLATRADLVAAPELRRAIGRTTDD